MTLKLARKKILLIDDYPTMRQAIRNMLDSLGAKHIVEAGNGVDALKALKADTFDIVLCDYSLGPGKNGQQVLEEVRLQKLLPVTSIFMMISAEQNSGMVLGVMENKPDEYLAKPFNAIQLFSRLQKNHARKTYLSQIELEIERGNIDLAIQRCDKLLAEDNKSLRTVLLKIRADLALHNGDYDKATEIFELVLEQRELPWARLGLGIISYHQQQYQIAAACFQDIINKNPLFIEAYDWLIQCYETLDQSKQSEEILNKAVELSPYAILRHKKLANTATKNNNWTVAERALKDVVKLGKYSIHKSSHDFVNLAKFYNNRNAVDKALENIKEMRREFAGDVKVDLHACSMESEIFTQQGNKDKAQKSFNKAIALHRDLQGEAIDPITQLDLANASLANYDHPGASKVLDSLIKNNVENDHFMEQIRTSLQQTEHAQHYEQLIKKTKQQLIDINNQGVALFNQGKLKEAMALLHKANEKIPHNKTILMNLAKIALHDIKVSGPLPEKIRTADNYIKKSQEIGVSLEKINALQKELAYLTKSVKE